MLTSLSLFPLISIFILSAIVVWYAGIKLSHTTDIIDTRFGFGEALGGLIFLAITTNLPEIAIVTTASYTNHIDLAIGNILGGIAVQTVVLALLDGFGLKRKAALTYQAASLQLVLEGLLVVTVLVIAIMGVQLPKSMIIGRIAPADLFIVMIWFIGLWLISKAKKNLAWYKKGKAPFTISISKKEKLDNLKKWSTPIVIIIFLFASLATLIAGVFLEESSIAIAKHIGWSGMVFGATVLAAATALPEVSTGLTAIKIGDYTLAISDIFGGNAFLPVLFLPATVLAGQSILPLAQKEDIYLSGLGILLTVVYMYGLIFRPKKQVFCIGIDSFIVVIFYIVGLCGLAVI